MERRRILAAALCFACALCVAEDNARSYVDGKGNTVVVPATVTRVAANGAINQTVLVLGGADKLVATSSIVQANPMFVKIYPRIAALPAPFGTDLKSLNIEELMSARPQVVFGSFDRLKGSDVAQVETSMTNPDEIKKTILLVGQILGAKEEARAKEYIAYYDANVQFVTDRTAKLPEGKRPKVYLASGTDGLRSEGKNSIVSFWIDAAGGRNVASPYISTSGTMIMENIVAENPAVIITTTKSVRDKIMKDNKWASIDAVKNSRVYVNPKGVYLWSVRSAEGALQYLWAAKVCHPELFTDLDVAKKVASYYQAYYGYALSNAEIQSILVPEN